MPTYLPFAFVSIARATFFFLAFSLDSSQTSVASGFHAKVKDDLLLAGFMGLRLPAVPSLPDFQSSRPDIPPQRGSSDCRMHQRNISP